MFLLLFISGRLMHGIESSFSASCRLKSFSVAADISGIGLFSGFSVLQATEFSVRIDCTENE